MINLYLRVALKVVIVRRPNRTLGHNKYDHILNNNIYLAASINSTTTPRFFNWAYINFSRV